MGQVFSTLSTNLRNVLGDEVAGFINPGGGGSGWADFFGKGDLLGIMKPEEPAPPSPTTPATPAIALPDDAANQAEKQRNMARKYANRGREGTILADTSNLG